MLSTTAFNDKFRQPSVDIASLRISPDQSKKSPEDGIAILIAGEVQALVIPIPKPPLGGSDQYDVGVWARPEESNVAHAQIETSPELTTSHFDKLKEALVRLATKREWVIKPT